MSEQELEPTDQPSVGTPKREGVATIPDWCFWCVPVLIALLLRYASLELNSLSHDELSTWARTEYNRLRGVIEYGVKPDYHPPGHFFLIWAVKQMGWESAFALRLPSVIASVLSVGFTYRIGRTLFDKWTGSMAAMLMSVNWACVYYAQDARAYAFVILFALMAVDATIRIVAGLRGGHRVPRADWLQLILAGAVGAYVHYYGLFFAGLLGMGTLLVLIRTPKAMLKAALAFLAILALYGPWIPILIDDLGHSKTWVARHGVEFFPRWWSWVFGSAELPSMLTAIIVVLGGWSMLVRKGEQNNQVPWFATGMVVAWLLVPGLVAFTKSLLSTPALTNRNILSSAPALFLLVAITIRYFPGKHWVRSVLFLGVVGTSLWDLVVTKSYYVEPTKEEYRDVIEAVVNAAPGAPFARCGIKAHFAYYLKQYGADVEIEKNLCREPHLADFVERGIDEEFSFVRVHYRPEQVVLDHLDDAYLTTQVFKARDAVGMVLRPRTSVADGAQPLDVAALDGEQPESSVTCEEADVQLSRIGAWSVWPYRPGILMDTLDRGVRFRRSTKDSDRLLMCTRERFSVADTLRFSGSWSVVFGEDGGSAQLSARYYGSDNKWVEGEAEQRPVWMVKTTKKSIEMTPFNKLLDPPDDARTVQLCAIVTGAESRLELQDVCVSPSS